MATALKMAGAEGGTVSTGRERERERGGGGVIKETLVRTQWHVC